MELITHVECTAAILVCLPVQNPTLNKLALCQLLWQEIDVFLSY